MQSLRPSCAAAVFGGRGAFDQVRELAPALLPDLHAPVVVYCASDTCQNSHIAARVLEQIGYTDVAVYAGGKKDWSEAGLPVERGSIAQAA